MAYSRARQERYVKTKKGKAAHSRASKKYMEKKRKSLEGRIDIKYVKTKCEHGKEVADWWLKQKSICYMCGPKVIYEKAPTRKNGRSNSDELVIDHDHSKKKFIPRGLLCQRHNLGFGMFKENIEELKRAIKYKRKFS